MNVLTEKMNIIYGLIVTAMSAVFGKYWYLFAGFLILNIVDYVTGMAKAKFYTKKVSSSVGAKGILKKVWYWVVIGIAFFVSMSFVQLGETIGVNLQVVVLFGWFTLASYLVNEIRSILENLVEMNIKVPKFLVKGLEVAEKMIDEKSGGEASEN